MPLEYQGPLGDHLRAELESFASELEQHPKAGPLNGRLVVADPDPNGLRATIGRALAIWMKDDEYEEWRQQQVNRPVTTAGKTFIADDEMITAVVAPVPSGDAEFLGIASHELVEIAHKCQDEAEGWVPPTSVRELHGIVLFDEYANDRIRQEITTKLGWSESRIDAEVELDHQTDDLLQAMPPERANPPPTEFWMHWVNIARVWAMVAGRRAGGSRSAAVELGKWAQHPLIADQAWQPVESACDDLYRQLHLSRDQLVALAASRVWDPIEVYGREVWPAP